MAACPQQDIGSLFLDSHAKRPRIRSERIRQPYRTDPLIGIACIRHNRAVSIFPEHAAIANPCGDAEAMEQIAGQALHRVGGETDILETAIRHRIGGQSAGYGTCGRYAKIQSGREKEQTAELQSLMRNSYAVFCLKKQTKH